MLVQREAQRVVGSLQQWLCSLWVCFSSGVLPVLELKWQEKV